MKIFLTGFQRSGTTLLRHIITNHPAVKKIFYENCLLGKGMSYIESICDFDINKEIWGEKLPWFDVKPRVSLYDGTIIDYCKDWTKLFPDTKIIQIVRHPVDVINSNLIKFNIKNEKTFEAMNNYFPNVIPKINAMSNCLSIKFEDLVVNPTETLITIYNFLELDSSLETIMSIIKNKKYRLPRISKHRAFAFIKEETNLKNFNFDKIIHTLNEIEGVKY